MINSRFSSKGNEMLKNKRFHISSILREVKNRSVIEEIDNERKFSEANFVREKPKKRRKARFIPHIEVKPPREETKESARDSSISSYESCSEDEDENMDEIVMKRRPSNMKKISLIPHEPVRNPMERRSSRLEMRLDEIIKYSHFFPSRKESQRQIDSSINQLITNTAEVFSHRSKSKFSRFNNEDNKENESKLEAEKKIQKTERKVRHTTKEENVNKVDESMFVDFGDRKIVEEKEDASRKKNMNFLIKKSRDLIIKNQRPFDYSLENFIESELNELRNKTSRKTVGATYTIRNCRNVRDVREEDIQNIHRFLRAEPKEGDEFGSSITTKEMESFKLKYDIYQNIYKKTKDNFNTDKMGLNLVDNLNMKNAIYLNESLKQANSREARKQVEKVMKNLNFYS